MDLIRIFATTAFSDISERYCLYHNDSIDGVSENLMIDETLFVDECRLHHGYLSDDQIRMIYGLFRDDWSEQFWNTESEAASMTGRSIFNVLFRLANDLLRIKDCTPLVRFRHLFRWWEVTQLLGEDLLVGAFLAYKSKDKTYPECQFSDFSSYPTVLHNDNPDLNFLFENLGLCELHSHLGAATDTFTLSWVCVMNHIYESKKGIRKIARNQDASREQKLYNEVLEAVSEACQIRLRLWKYVTGKDDRLSEPLSYSLLDSELKELGTLTFEERANEEDFDYITIPERGMMDVFAGERLFLFLMFSRLLRSDNCHLHKLFYRYILRKNYIRSLMVQVNDNSGFANFQRYQNLKSCLLQPKYDHIRNLLPVWEASKFNYTKIYEARVTPHKKPNDLKNLYDRIMRVCNEDGIDPISLDIIYHFIKHGDREYDDFQERDWILRSEVTHQSNNLKAIKSSEPAQAINLAIDAASSELYCRPEAFAQSFRFLKECGYSATFHAGEDFYDIADGLRAIFETVRFFGLEAGDRIGHAIALGLDPFRFYSERHNYIALPMQWMLDNVVWLYFYARQNNVDIASGTEEFLLSSYRDLLVKIGYTKYITSNFDIHDYYMSILLRGDNPRYYHTGHFDVSSSKGVIKDNESWGSFDLQDNNTQLASIRKSNGVACQLISEYHFNRDIKRIGKLIKSFKVPESYPRLIHDIQEMMIREVSKRRLGIECCPSSNYRIGHLQSFECHPIFKFMPVRGPESHYPLAVTVNTDDLGIFATSLPNELSLLALALLKKKDGNGNHMYSSQEVYDWIERVIKNGYKYHFSSLRSKSLKSK